jgi:Stage II sporulation protein E (SpoIIE)
MGLRFLWRLLSPALLVLGNLTPAEPSDSVHQPTSEPEAPPSISIGRSFVTLYGPWKFQIGDSPIDSKTGARLWAEPEYDDSNWERIDLTPKPGVVYPVTLDPEWVPGWTSRGHPGYRGWAWYRIRLRVTIQPGIRLGLNGPNRVDDAYQAFADGQLIGSLGEFKKEDEGPPAPEIPTNMFLLPPGQPVGGAGPETRTLTLAFRVWMNWKAGAMLDAGGMHIAPQLGDLDTVRVLHQLDWKTVVLWYMAAPLEIAIPFLLGVVAASLLLFDRTDRTYVWLAAVLLFSALSATTQCIGFYFPRLLSFDAQLRYELIFYLPLHLGGWTMVWWHWFRFRRPSWVPWAAGSLTILYMVAGALTQVIASASAIQTLFLAITVVKLMFLALLVFIVVKGIPEYGLEALFVLPAVFLMAPMQFTGELLTLHLPAFWKFFGIGIPAHMISNALLWVVVALLLLRRLLLTVRREKQMALDIKQAQEVQQVILPEQRTTLPGMIVDCEFHPALEVGGDFFQVIPHPTDGSLLIVAGDVTGKGLQAGMLVALLVGAIRTLAPSDPDPLSILAALNHRLYGRPQAHATCLALRIAANGEATLANAGHLPPYLNGEPLEVGGSLPLGIVEHPEFSIANFFVAENDRLVLVSDGVVEATNGQSQLFGFERLQELLDKAATAADIAAAAKRFGQQDDISVISVSRVARESALTAREFSTEGANLGVTPA